MTEIDQFLSELQAEDLASGTIVNYGANLRMFAQWVTGQGKTIPALTPADLKQYKAELKARYKPATVNIKLAAVKLFLKWCLASGLIQESPMSKLKTLKTENLPRWLNQEQVTRILEAVEGSVMRIKTKSKPRSPKLKVAVRMWAIAVFLLNTGLRVSELCNLRLEDVKNGVVVVKWGKGGKWREVPLNTPARMALDEWLKFRRSSSDYVFATTDRMTRQLVAFHLAVLGQRLGFKLTPHLLRHTFGKNLIDKNVPIDRVAKLMGHSDINTTAIYTMPGLEDLRRAVTQLE